MLVAPPADIPSSVFFAFQWYRSRLGSKKKSQNRISKMLSVFSFSENGRRKILPKMFLTGVCRFFRMHLYKTYIFIIMFQSKFVSDKLSLLKSGTLVLTQFKKRGYGWCLLYLCRLGQQYIFLSQIFPSGPSLFPLSDVSPSFLPEKSDNFSEKNAGELSVGEIIRKNSENRRSRISDSPTPTKFATPPSRHPFFSCFFHLFSTIQVKRPIHIIFISHSF